MASTSFSKLRLCLRNDTVCSFIMRIAMHQLTREAFIAHSSLWNMLLG
jgi:hypothetical protein